MGYYCPYCGTYLNDTDKVCSSCGRQLDVQQPEKDVQQPEKEVQQSEQEVQSSEQEVQSSEQEVQSSEQEVQQSAKQSAQPMRQEVGQSSQPTWNSQSQQNAGQSQEWNNQPQQNAGQSQGWNNQPQQNAGQSQGWNNQPQQYGGQATQGWNNQQQYGGQATQGWNNQSQQYGGQATQGWNNQLQQNIRQSQPVTPPVPPVQPAPQPQPTPQPKKPEPTMKWFKFVVWLQLWLSAIVAAANAVLLLTGSNYADITKLLSSDFASAFNEFMDDASRMKELVYAAYPSLKMVDLGCGIAYAVVAVLAIIVRFRLSGKKKNGPSLYIFYLFVEVLLSIAYTGLVIHAIQTLTIDASFISSMVSIGWSVILIFLNMVYFKKRKHMFTK